MRIKINPVVFGIAAVVMVAAGCTPKDDANAPAANGSSSSSSQSAPAATSTGSGGRPGMAPGMTPGGTTGAPQVPTTTVPQGDFHPGYKAPTQGGH